MHKTISLCLIYEGVLTSICFSYHDILWELSINWNEKEKVQFYFFNKKYCDIKTKKNSYDSAYITVYIFYLAKKLRLTYDY